MYSKLTETQKAEIIKSAKCAQAMGSDVLHAAAVAAHAVLSKTTRRLNGKIGADAFAAALTVLVFEKQATVTWPENGGKK